MTSSSVESVDTSGEGVKAVVKTKKGEEILEADIVLSAVGIKSNIENIGLEDVGIVTDRDKIIVNDFYQTNIPGYYAIGDVVPGPALAHVASAEGITCVEKIAGLHTEAIDYGNIPGCTYATPEIASVGLTEAQALEKGYELKIGKFPFSASGKAKAAGTPDECEASSRRCPNNRILIHKKIFSGAYRVRLFVRPVGAGAGCSTGQVCDLSNKLNLISRSLLTSTGNPCPTRLRCFLRMTAIRYSRRYRVPITTPTLFRAPCGCSPRVHR